VISAEQHRLDVCCVTYIQPVNLSRFDEDCLFPSLQKNGAQPIQPDMILRRQAADELAACPVAHSPHVNSAKPV